MQLAYHQALGLWRNATTCRPASRRPLRCRAAAAKDEDEAAKVKSARLARILRQYDKQDPDSQKAELQEYMYRRREWVGGDDPEASRMRRASTGTRATPDPGADLREINRYFPERPVGNTVKRVPNYGLHGKGELQWWALFVKAGQEKKVAEGLTKYMSELPPLDPLEEGGEPRERVVETRYPKKSLKVWNPKTGKMGTKVLRYPSTYAEVLVGGLNGGWVLLRTVMDFEAHQRIVNHPAFCYFLHCDQVTDRQGVYRKDFRKHDFPKPCPPEVLEEVDQWEADLRPVLESTVKDILETHEEAEGRGKGPQAYGEDSWQDPNAFAEAQAAEAAGQDRAAAERRPFGGDRTGGFGPSGGRGRGRGGRERFQDARGGEQERGGGGGGGWYEGGAGSGFGGGYERPGQQQGVFAASGGEGRSQTGWEPRERRPYNAGGRFGDRDGDRGGRFGGGGGRFEGGRGRFDGGRGRRSEYGGGGLEQRDTGSSFDGGRGRRSEYGGGGLEQRDTGSSFDGGRGRRSEYGGGGLEQRDTGSSFDGGRGRRSEYGGGGLEQRDTGSSFEPRVEGREGWQDRSGGRSFERRGGADGGEGQGWQPRSGGRQFEERCSSPSFGGGRGGGERREYGGGRGRGERREFGGRGRGGERRQGGRQEQGNDWSSKGWFEGDAGASGASPGAGAGAGMDSPWGPADDLPVAASTGSGTFSGWVDSAADAFDFGSPAAAAPAANPAGSNWSWGEALGQQPAAAAAAAPPAEQPPAATGPAVGTPGGFSAADAAGMWDEQPAADLGWGAAPAAPGGDSVAYGIPQQRGSGEWRPRGADDSGGGRGGRGGRFGDRGSDRGGRFGGRGGRGGGGGAERSDRRGGERRGGGGDRFADRERRGGRDGGAASGAWYEGGDSGSSAAAGASPAADLSWWDNPGASDDTGFAGMYKGSAEWERGEEARSSSSRRRSDRSAEPSGGAGDSPSPSATASSGAGGGGEDAWWVKPEGEPVARGGGGGGNGGGGGSGGASAADAAAAAAFTPGQAVAVTAGNFRDFEGTVVASEGGRVTTELDIFGKRTRVELSPSEVVPASSDGKGDSGGGSGAGNA
ncbi:hypothetical protein ACK3TF_003490 [Chlorella vulgaris]